MSSLFELLMLIVLILAALACVVYWTAVGYHVVRTKRIIPTARDGLALSPVGDQHVCVLVPAHNEAATIAEVAGSLVGQDHPALSCVFVLDRCTDDTRGILERTWAAAPVPPTGSKPALEIIEIGTCPAGWTGKSHALWRAVHESRAAAAADLLLFVDADTILHPGLIRASVALLRKLDSRMLSLLSTLTHDRWFEWVVQPATSMELLRQYPIVRANARPPARRRAFANGQFILFDRKTYFDIGGHEIIKDEVLEDVLLARRCDTMGVNVSLLLSDGLLRCRMYDSFEAFTRGWRRIYTESANRKPARLRQQADRVRLLGTILPLLAFAGIFIGLWRLGGPHVHLARTAALLGLAASLSYGIVVALIYASARTPLWSAPSFPIGCWITGSILRAGANDLESGRPIVWAGREYIRQVRR